MKKWLLFLCAFLLSVVSVHAHVVAGENGFVSGATHPLFGFDHLLAMLAVGVISVTLTKKIWTLPLVFVLSMVSGGILGILGISLLGVEYGIVLSVILLGLAIAFAFKFKELWAIIVVAIFAVFHGHAHGEEMPQIAMPILYVLGFVLSTIFLHLSGILVGLYARQSKVSQKIVQAGGIAMASFGVYLLLFV
ncbi:HupE/UreJ family protein [Candidatus Woesearchaeota archaeon]|nr:HupE/UreJ family protein [Nanoarchaeota archaeon]MCB9370397.1 HupE/UreJ family protein [Candidatus Woesearchaeota archaeon]USN44915.1 MAG: HupE/UreJ family protein [Candidatus Woesearchaeota archaeon]